MFAWEIVIVLLLIVLNGFFAMSELAVVSARRARLQVLEQDGVGGARAALHLSEAPGRFLSTVQIGITLIGIFAGAYGGATIAGALAVWLDEHFASLGTEAAGALALAIVVAAITYLSLIVGELVPKQLALRHPERIAVLVAPIMLVISRLALPLVFLLDVSTRIGLRLVGGHAASEQKVSDEEIKTLIAEATEVGVVKQAERAMIAGVMRLADRPVTALMTPRPDIAWLDLDDDEAATRAALLECRYSRLPVCKGDPDEIQGVVEAKDLLNRALAGQPLDLRAVMREPLVVHDGVSALGLLESIKQSPLHMALVVDEYGSLRGLVTANDILEAIVGELAEHGAEADPSIVQREDGSWLMDGGVAIDEIKETLGLRSLPDEDDYDTLAGLVLAQLERLPSAGDHFTLSGYRFEVVDMDERRIDKVLISAVEP
ncbi:putative hemolysin [Plasticicumulans lactativorans]|uniref:Putative hemolysin n=1 Tax=Plasticicumulans lactativorans TaxID=1133106 RepID=A0A4R2L5Q3_9GAMM|nr:hemolysin family protein [Plasticicumulans lactativorans]TCO82724.1 putative hemolysin [Plasticicumulans lactativorans]